MDNEKLWIDTETGKILKESELPPCLKQAPFMPRYWAKSVYDDLIKNMKEIDNE